MPETRVPASPPAAWTPTGRHRLRLTARGRRSGRERTVTLWFIGPEADGSVYVWRTRGSSGWVANVRADPMVRVDFGSGSVAARAAEVRDPERRDRLLGAFLAKYRLARLFRVLGWTARARYFRLAPTRSQGPP